MQPLESFDPNALLTARDVAGPLRVKSDTVEAWGRTGRLRRVVLAPRCVRFRVADVLAFIAAGAEGESATQTQ